ncbi:hypothetical protein [Stutzerimonas stutzeri]|uniref:hypothetical protein n=1 Tax=Stutzerimonas stutzeri TaxID=316 RepID=UPI003C7035D8
MSTFLMTGELARDGSFTPGLYARLKLGGSATRRRLAAGQRLIGVPVGGESVTCCNSRRLNYEFCEKALFAVRFIWHNASLKPNYICLSDVMPTH